MSIESKLQYLLRKKEYAQGKIEFCESQGFSTEYHENKLAYINSRIKGLLDSVEEEAEQV